MVYELNCRPPRVVQTSKWCEVQRGKQPSKFIVVVGVDGSIKLDLLTCSRSVKYRESGMREAGSECKGTKDPGTFVNRVVINLKKAGIQAALSLKQSPTDEYSRAS